MRTGCRVGLGKAVPPVWAEEGVGTAMRRGQNDHNSMLMQRGSGIQDKCVCDSQDVRRPSWDAVGGLCQCHILPRVSWSWA